MDDSSSIIKTPGKITENIYLVDLYQYGFPMTCSAFIFKTLKSIIIMDTGTSNEIPAIIKFMQQQELSLKKIEFLIPSHAHFDHSGGVWQLWETIKDHNPNVKVLTTEATQKQLQDPTTHMMRAKRTFGDLVGEMKALPDNAYEITVPNEPLKISGLEDSKEFMLVSSPGHTPDQVCPTLFEEGRPEFMFLAEAAGSLFHSQRLVTLGTGMPPGYNFKTYVESLNKIIELEPSNVGYCHFGAVKGKENVLKVLKENLEFSYFFRDFVKEKYMESGKTRFVVEQFVEQELEKRTEFPKNALITNVIAAIVYGELIDLGLKEPK